MKGNNGKKPPVTLMPAPAPKKRTKLTPISQARPTSSRARDEQRLEAALLEALATHFAQHGAMAIERVFARSPEAYLRVAVKCLPQRAGDDAITPDDVRVLAGLARAIRDRYATGQLAPGQDAPESSDSDVH